MFILMQLLRFRDLGERSASYSMHIHMHTIYWALPLFLRSKCIMALSEQSSEEIQTRTHPPSNSGLR